MNLYRHQLDGIEFIKKHKHVLLGFEAGCGKTATSLVAALGIGAKNIIVFCPKYLVFNWHNEIEKFAPELKNSIKVIPYSNLKGEIGSPDFIICDEVQFLKNIKAKRSAVIHSLIKKVKPEYLVLLSGTPFKNSIKDVYSLLKILSYTNANNGRKMLMTNWSFNMTFLNMVEKRFNGRRVILFEGLKNEDELRSYLKDKYQRKLLKDCIDLPDLIYKEIPFSDKVDKALENAFNDFEEKKPSFSTVKKDNAINKVSFTIDYVSELLENGIYPLIIFSDHVDPISILSEKFSCPKIDGSTSIEDRTKYFTDFQRGLHKVLCGTIGAMSTGVNLTVSSNVIYNDYPWQEADLLQSQARVHRIGQQNKCICHYILGSKTDSHILKLLRRKANEVRRIEKT